MNELTLHPVDFFNLNGSFESIFKDDKSVHIINDQEVGYPDLSDIDSDINRATFKLNESNQVSVLKNNPFDIAVGVTVSKFTLLAAIKFKGNYKGAESYILYKLMKIKVPYVRVGTKYYKTFPVENNWGGNDVTLNLWEKTIITDDHSKSILKLIPTFDTFIIKPDNKNHSRAIKNCYNLYAPFPHTPSTNQVTVSDIPNSMTVMKHIFGEQLEAGFIYMKCLYEHPRQMLPVIILMSKVRGTGKSTFTDWIKMIFGQNVVPVDPKSLSTEHNSSYAKSNILLFEETLIEKSASIEKVKHLTTAKFISYRDLYVSSVTIPFFGKLIMNTNKVLDFMRIDTEETRFWIRYVNVVPEDSKNTKIDRVLFTEIPDFLRYLNQLPAIDFTKDRLVLTPDQTRTKQLDEVKAESRSGLYKELEIFINDFFANNDMDTFYATAKDIKDQWFVRDTRISIAYIRKVIINEMNLKPQKTKRYTAFDNDSLSERVGLPFLFVRPDEIDKQNATSTSPKLEL